MVERKSPGQGKSASPCPAGDEMIDKLTEDIDSLEAWQLGIDRGDHVKSVSFHQYANGNSPWVRLQNSYMNHTANEANITQYLPEIEFASEYQPFIPFVLGETNSNSYNLNMSQIEGVFGSALWLIDHLMIGMSLVSPDPYSGVESP